MFTITDGVNTAYLPNPEQNNSIILDKGLIVHRTRHNVPLTGYQDYPQIDTRKYSFVSICGDIKDDLIEIFDSNIAKSITITDHNSTTMSVIMISSTFDISTQRDLKAYDVVIEVLVLATIVNYIVTDNSEYIITDSGDKIIGG